MCNKSPANKVFSNIKKAGLKRPAFHFSLIYKLPSAAATTTVAGISATAAAASFFSYRN